MDVVGIDPRRVWWALPQFTDRGVLTVQDLIDQIDAGDRQCWAIIDGSIRGVALTQITNDRLKVCHITHLTGEGLREWEGAFNVIEAWALSQGCHRIKAVARPGYERIGKKYGLQKTHVVLEKDLPHGRQFEDGSKIGPLEASATLHP